MIANMLNSCAANAVKVTWQEIRIGSVIGSVANTPKSHFYFKLEVDGDQRGCEWRAFLQLTKNLEALLRRPSRYFIFELFHVCTAGKWAPPPTRTASA